MRRNKLSFLLGLLLLASIALTECRKDNPAPATVENNTTSSGTTTNTASNTSTTTTTYSYTTSGIAPVSTNSSPPGIMP